MRYLHKLRSHVQRQVNAHSLSKSRLNYNKSMAYGAITLAMSLLLAACTPGATSDTLLNDAATTVITNTSVLPTVDDILATEAITTSFEDSYPERNLFGASATFTDIRTLPRNGNGYTLTPGLYELEAESFCLRAGTHGPSAGDGYLPAPLLGDREAIVYKILATYAGSTAVSQRDAQVLIWAIVANTRYTDMSPRVQLTAAALLTEEELFTLNDGAIGLIPDQVWFELEQQIPAPVRQVYIAERRMRNLINQADSSYETLEDVAVLTGAAPAASLIREIPRGQWAAHPDGYLIRYFPSGYSRTRVEVFVPPEQSSVLFDPSRTVAAPANTGAQRLGIGIPSN